MKVKTEVTIDIVDNLYDIASSLASADDEVQGRFLNAFAQCLYGFGCGKGELQLCYVKDHLTDDTKELFKMLCYEE